MLMYNTALPCYQCKSAYSPYILVTKLNLPSVQHGIQFCTKAALLYKHPVPGSPEI